MFKRRPSHLLNVACTFHLHPESWRIAKRINWFNILYLKYSGKHLWWCLSIMILHLLYWICYCFENIFVCWDIKPVNPNSPFLFPCFLVFWCNCYWVLESTTAQKMKFSIKDFFKDYGVNKKYQWKVSVPLHPWSWW